MDKRNLLQHAEEAATVQSQFRTVDSNIVIADYMDDSLSKGSDSKLKIPKGKSQCTKRQIQKIINKHTVQRTSVDTYDLYKENFIESQRSINELQTKKEKNYTTETNKFRLSNMSDINQSFVSQGKQTETVSLPKQSRFTQQFRNFDYILCQPNEGPVHLTMLQKNENTVLPKTIKDMKEIKKR